MEHISNSPVIENTLKWKVAVGSLFEEIIGSNKAMWIMKHPLQITYSILQKIAKHAAETQDEKLIGYMCRLGMYEFADPSHPEYNKDAANKYIELTK